jgi:hypothetical protein
MYDFATAPFRISLYLREILFYFFQGSKKTLTILSHTYTVKEPPQQDKDNCGSIFDDEPSHGSHFLTFSRRLACTKYLHV